MTSFIQVKRICEHCNQEFLAKTTVTRFCSKTCSSRFIKAKKRNEKISAHNMKHELSLNSEVEKLKTKEFLKVKEVASLLDCSSRSVYYYIDQGVIEVINIGQRMTRVKRSSIDKLIEQKSSIEKEEEQVMKNYTINDCVSTFEIREKFGISESGLRKIIIKNDIPKYRKGSLAYLPKELVEKYTGFKFEN